MKKIMFIISLALLLVACSTNKDLNNEKKEMIEETNTENNQDKNSNESTITINAYDENREKITVEVPKNPTNIAVLDLVTLDTIDALGKGDSIKGLSKGSIIPGKDEYYENSEIRNLGTVKEVDLEELVSQNPEIIFIGGRLQEQYEELSKIAPVVFTTTTSEASPYNDYKENILEISKIFESEDLALEKLNSYEERLINLKKQSEGFNAISAIVAKGNISLLGNSGRGALIFKDAGFENLVSEETSTHGNSVSFESILSINPDFIFVLDRDSAINTEGAQLAKDILDNEIINKTQAYKNNRIIYLEPSIWYLAEGGLNSLDMMISDLESYFEN